MRLAFGIVLLVFSLNTYPNAVLPANYSPPFLKRENANIFVNDAMENRQLRVSISETGSYPGGVLTRSDGVIPITNFQFRIRFENLHDSYIFLRVRQGNHATKKGPAYPSLSACSYGSTTPLFIDTDETTFVLAPQEARSFSAYTNQSDIANFFYPNTVAEYNQNLATYADYYSPHCLSFPFDKFAVPKDELVSESASTAQLDVEDFLSEMEPTDIDPPTNNIGQIDLEEAILSKEARAITVLEGDEASSTRVSTEHDQQSASNGPQYDEGACDKALAETRAQHKELLELIQTAGNNRLSSGRLMERIDAATSYSNDFFTQLSPACFGQLTALNEQFSLQIQAKINSLLQNMSVTPKANLGGPFFQPRFTTQTSVAPTLKKKTSSKKHRQKSLRNSVSNF